MAVFFKRTLKRFPQLHRTNKCFAQKYGTEYRFKVKAFGIVQSSKNTTASLSPDQPELQASSIARNSYRTPAGASPIPYSSLPEFYFDHVLCELQKATSTFKEIKQSCDKNVTQKHNLQKIDKLFGDCSKSNTICCSSTIHKRKSCSVHGFRISVQNFPDDGNFLNQTTNLKMDAPHRHYATQQRSRTKEKTSYYDVLNTTPNATQAQVKKAYFKLSKIYHPDKNAGSKEAQRKFALINEAYSVLGNITLRKRYDRGTLNQRDVHVGVSPEEKAAEEAAHRDPMETYSGVMFNVEAKRQAKNMDEFFSKHYKDARDKEQRDRAERQQRIDEYMDLQKKAKLSPLVLALFMLGSLVMGVRSITKNNVVMKTKK